MDQKIIKETHLCADLPESKDELEHRLHEKKQKLLNYQKTHDIKHITRRDLLASGVCAFAGSMISSPWLSLLAPQKAYAQGVNCNVEKIGMVPLITLNLTGGANLASHFLPRNAAGDLLPSYSKLGWGLQNAFSVDTEFKNGAKFFAGSTFLAGLRTAIGANNLNLLQKVYFVGLPARSQDDTAQNRLDITGLAQSAGYKGDILNSLGTRNTVTGNGTQPAFVTPKAPLIVSSYLDVEGALGVRGVLEPMGRTAIQKMFSAVEQLNAFQGNRIVQANELNSAESLHSIVACRSKDNVDRVSDTGANNTDPFRAGTNTPAGINFGLAANTSRSSRNYVFATLVHNTLNGYAGTSNLTLGGYDYHDGTRATGDNMDRTAGDIVGRVIKTALDSGKDAFILVTTDGSTTSVESNGANSAWASDGGVRGCLYMIAVDSTGKIASVAGDQLNFFSAEQAADDTLISSPERAAAAMFVNWMAMNNRVNDAKLFIPGLQTEDIRNLAIFNKPA